MAFNKNWLRTMAESAVFQRGEDIYRAQPIKVNKDGAIYTAKVWGTARYEVVINLEEEEPICSCTCPYDYGDICKHIVAVGLAIIDNKVHTNNRTPDFIEDAEIEETPEPDFYRTVFLEAKLSTQAAFLKQLFEKNTAIREQFLHFIKADKPAFQKDDILKIRDIIHQKLNTLEVEYDYNEYDYEGNGMYDSGLAAIEEVVTPYFKNADTKLHQGNLTGAVAVLAGVYEACHNLEAPLLADEYEWEMFSDFESDVMGIFIGQLQELSNHLPNIIIDPINLTKAINIIFERINYYTEDPASRSHPMVYDLKEWEPLLLQLLIDKQIAKDLYNMLQEEELIDDSTANIVLKIAELTGDEALWLKTAEANAPHDPKIALQLLNKYYEAINMDAFYKIATAVYDTHQNIISSYLADIIMPERDRPFYMKVMQHHTRLYKSIEHYKRLREVMNPAEKERFIHSLRNDWQPNFYIQVLEVEQDWDTLLKTAKANIQSMNYLLYLKAVVAARPQECWALTTERIQTLLAAGTRGREWYRTFADELHTLGSVSPDWMQQARAFGVSVLSAYARLNAMKEEFRRVGVG
ncbi:MAG: SWIM zinc finger domain-containing protein [Saprospiraceae bacterium]